MLGRCVKATQCDHLLLSPKACKAHMKSLSVLRLLIGRPTRTIRAVKWGNFEISKGGFSEVVFKNDCHIFAG